MMALYSSFLCVVVIKYSDQSNLDEHRIYLAYTSGHSQSFIEGNQSRNPSKNIKEKSQRTIVYYVIHHPMLS